MSSNNQSNDLTGISATVYALFNAYFMVPLDIPVKEQAYEKVIKNFFSEKNLLEFSIEEFSRWNVFLNEVFSKFNPERKDFIQCTIQAILCKYFSQISDLFNEIYTHHPENWFMYAPDDEVEVSKKDCIKNYVSSEKHQCIVDFILKFLQRYGSFSPLSNESNETDSNPPNKKKKRVDQEERDLDNISPKRLDFNNDDMNNNDRYSTDMEGFKELMYG